MARGPSYTAEEDELMTTLAKDKSLSHSDKVEQFFARITGPSDRTRDAISQKIRKLTMGKKKKSKESASTDVMMASSVAADSAKRGRGRPPKRRPETILPSAPINGNGKNGHGKGVLSGDIEVPLCGVMIKGPAAKVGALITQLAS